MIPLVRRDVAHRWRFFRAGGFDQVRLDSGNDIAALDKLDQKLWAALSCPTRGLEFDEKTLDLIDTDKDGRIRAPEIIAAALWTTSLLKDPDVLIDSGKPLELSQINDATDEGRQLLDSARQILANLGKSGQSVITVEDTADTQKIFAQTRFNGDGVIPAESADDPALRQVIIDILACTGGVTDRSGRPGLTQEKLDLFFKEAEAFAAWQQKLTSDPAARPLGQATAAAFASYSAVRAKVEDYFARCRLAAFDPRAEAAMNRPEADYLALSARQLTRATEELASFPLARIEAGRALPLTSGLNPAWEMSITRLASDVVAPLLGEQTSTSLSESQWQTIVQKLAAYEAWLAAKAGALVEPLGIQRVTEILGAGSGTGGAPAPAPARQAIADLIAQDKALEPQASAIARVDQLVRYKRDLYRLLTNYVNLKDFYSPDAMAIFQAGVLYLDQRSCELCLRVEDMPRHAALAPLSRAYLAYCECTRRGRAGAAGGGGAGEKMTIAAAFSAGDSDNLMVGRNGVFYDRKGSDWDATVVKIIEHPISIAQAFWSPYKRLLRWIEEQIAKRAAAADTAATAALTETTAAAASGSPAPAQPHPRSRIDIGTVAALGVAVGGLTTAFGLLLKWFFDMGLLMPLGLAGLILAISGPSMVIAWLKLRERNLGPMLDASGWAVNTRARINIPFGRLLTQRAQLPPGSQRDLFDPYAESKAARDWIIVGVLLVVLIWALWYFGTIERFCPGWFPRPSFLDRHLVHL